MPSVEAFGTFRIDLPEGLYVPDLISEAATTLPASASEFAETIDKLGAVSGVKSALGVIGAAATVAGPAGGIVSAAATIGSIFASLFGSSDPPQAPKIGGVNAESLVKKPLRSETFAVIAGRVVAGSIKTSGFNTDAILIGAKPAVQAALDDLANGRSRSDVNRMLKAVHRTTWRNVAMFCGYAPFEKLFDPHFSGSADRGKQLGKILAWVAPRVQLRQALAYYFFHEQAAAAMACTGGNCNQAVVSFWSPDVRKRLCSKMLRDGRGTIATVEDWPATRRLCSDGRTATGYAAHVRDLLLPIPVELAGVWQYNPVTEDVVRREIDHYEAAGIDEVEVGHLWKIRFPQSSFLLRIPYGWAEAARRAFKLAASDASYNDALRRGMTDMREGIKQVKSMGKIRAAIKRAKERQRARAGIVKIKGAIGRVTAQRRKRRNLIVAGAIAAAGAAAFAIR